MGSNLIAFGRALFQHWLSAMSGSLGVPLTVWGIFNTDGPLKTILLITGAICLGAAAYLVWKPEREARMSAERDISSLRSDAGALEFVFDESNPRCIRTKSSIYEDKSIAVKRWYVGIRNASKLKSLKNVSVQALDGDFVRAVIAIAHGFEWRRDGIAGERYEKLYEKSDLSPDAIDFFELFGVDAQLPGYGDEDILRTTQQFTLEARASDALTARATFEYNGTTRPPTMRRLL